MDRTSKALAEAKAHHAQGDLKRAEEECAAALRGDPSNAEANYLMGVIVRRSKGETAAMGFLEAAVNAAPTNADYLLDLALVLDSAGRPGEAWGLYQRAGLAAPRNPRVLGAAVNFMARSGIGEGLLPLYREAVSLGWRDHQTCLVAGDFFCRRFQYAEAHEVFTDALNLAPASAEARRGIGLTLAGLKRFGEALPYLEAGGTPGPGSALLKMHLWVQANLQAVKGAIALEEGDWAKATALLGASTDLMRKVLPATVPVPAPDRNTDSRVHNLLYIEVELRAREFEARVLLALHSAAQGMDAVVGQKAVFSQIAYARLPAGIVLVKTMNGNDVERIKRAAAAGHMVVVIDEEAFGGSGKRPLWMRLNTDPQALAYTDLVIAQGEEYGSLLTSVFPEAKAKTLVLGNPKVDLYRPEFRKVSDRPRDTILICSQSQVSNPRGVSFPDLISLHMRGVPMGERIGHDVIEGTKEVFGYEISMIPQLQAVTRTLAEKRPGAQILFRPHPAEDATLWERAFAGLANVTVSSAGSMTDALLDAKVLIYVRGCATGLEAHFQEVPIIRFDGDGRTPEPGNWTSSNIGFAATNATEVLVALARIEAGERTRVADRAVVAQSFHGIGERLVSVGVAAGLAGAIKPRLLPEPSARARLAGLSGLKTNLRDFDLQKFPLTSVAEVQELADRLARVAGLPAPKVEALAPNVFLFPRTDAED